MRFMVISLVVKGAGPGCEGSAPGAAQWRSNPAMLLSTISAIHGDRWPVAGHRLCDRVGGLRGWPGLQIGW